MGTCSSSTAAGPRRFFVYTGVTSVPRDALESIAIPSTVISIGQWQFIDCVSLREIVLNKGLRRIGSGAFTRCSSLESIRIPSTVISIGDREFNDHDCDGYTFYDCSSLREVVLNEGIQTIGVGAFSGCSSLESITIPSTVMSIGAYAFSRCSSLREVVLNERIQTIKDYTFCGCSSLERIRIPSTVISIGDSAFFGCSSLREVVLTKGIQTIKSEAFEGCSSLETFQFAEISKRYAAIRDIITVKCREELENKINAIPGMTMADSEISISLVTIQNWGTSRGPLLDILGLISFHEWEATIIVELALWKVNIDKIMGGDGDAVDRDVCSVEFPGPAMDAVLQFLSRNRPT